MAQPTDRAPSHDERWGDHVPWSLRYSVLSGKGDYRKFFSLLCDRLFNLFHFYEAGPINPEHFAARIASVSLSRFSYTADQDLELQLHTFFHPTSLDAEAKWRMTEDTEEREVGRLLQIHHGGAASNREYQKANTIADTTRQTRQEAHWRVVVAERLEVLQSIFVLLPQAQEKDALNSLVRDVRRFAAESNVLLDLRGNPPTVIPIEEPLLQQEVIDKLLPRLETTYPERAADLVKAYHDLLKGIDTNTVFGNAFKALEELAREISGEKKLELNERPALEKCSPNSTDYSRNDHQACRTPRR
ncbi:MAG: hypothetical protein ABI988_13350 [Nitrospirota bacterium]